MGLLEKFKNLFTEEVEDDVVEQVIETAKTKKEPVPVANVEKPIIKSIPKEPDIKIENISSTTIIKKEEPVVKSEIINPKKEEKFVFPVYFDDKDFVENPKKEVTDVKKVSFNMNQKKEPQRIEKTKETYNKKAQEAPTKKVFKPTPIISPVYGILDKNYYKEDIVVSSSSSNHSYYDSSKPISIDDVRKKAFGTLEDDLEKNLFDLDSKNNKSKSDDTIFDEYDFANAVEEDKRRDLTKDNLKADIESLLSNKEFSKDFEYNVSTEQLINEKTTVDVSSSSDEDISTDIPAEINDVIIDKAELDETENNLDLDNVDINSNLNEEEEDIIFTANNNSINDLSEDDDNNVPLENNKIEEFKKSNKNANDSQNSKYNDLLDEELMLGDNENNKDDLKDNLDITIDLSSKEIDKAYSDENDLNDSDLFNLIDSMYEKENK